VPNWGANALGEKWGVAKAWSETWIWPQHQLRETFKDLSPLQSASHLLRPSLTQLPLLSQFSRRAEANNKDPEMQTRASAGPAGVARLPLGAAQAWGQLANSLKGVGLGCASPLLSWTDLGD
jgi:hypothetical protein